MFWVSANDDGCRFGHHCHPRTSQHQLNIEVDRNKNNNYFNLMNLTKPFNSSLGKYMRKAAGGGGVDSLNPHRLRGKRLHHHGGGVCWLFALLWMDS
jgi:hypothetical protein